MKIKITQILRRYATNPIIIRELKGVFRKSNSFTSLIILALLSLVSVSTTWITMGAVGKIGLQVEWINKISRGLFIGTSYIIFFISSVLVLVATSNTIASERENKTFDLLIVTGLSRVQIILGKLISALGYIFFLILALLPVISISFILGGVSFGDIFASYVIIFTTLFALGMIGIMASAFSSTSKKAQGLAFLIAVLLYAVIPVGTEIYEATLGYRRSAPNLLMVLNPYFNLIRIFYGSGYWIITSSKSWMSVSPLLLPLISNGIVSGLALIVALRYFISPEKVRTKVRKKYIEDENLLVLRRKRFPYYIVDPLKKNREIQDNEQPAYVKEKRYTFASKMVYIIRFGYVTLIIGTIIGILLFLGPADNPISFYSGIALIIAGLFSITLSSGAVVDEVEKGTFDLLRSTLIRPDEVFFAKIRFILWCTFIVVCTFLSPGFVLSIIGRSGLYLWDENLSAWLLGLNVIIMSVLISTALGLFFSTLKTTKRNALSGAIFAFILLSLTPHGIMALWLLIEYLTQGRTYIPQMGKDVGNFFGGFLSPLHYLSVTLSKIDHHMPYISYITISNLCFVVFIVILYRLVYLRFRKIWYEGFRTGPSPLALLLGKVRRLLWAR